MQSIQALRGLVESRGRAARNLVAEKGSRRWSADEQALFDALCNDGEHAQAEIDARMAAEGSSAMQWARQREGVEIYMRTGTKVLATMSTTTGSEGGYTVPSLVSGDLIGLLKGYGWMRQVAADVTTDSGANLGYPTSDGTAETGELLVQNAAASTADMTFDTRSLNTYKFSSKAFAVPVELLQDSSVDVVTMVGQRAVDRIGRIQNQKFTTGTGSGEPTGLVTAASVGKTGTTGQTLTVIYDDLVDLAESVDGGHLGMPSKQAGMPEVVPGWMLSQAMRKVVRKLKDSNGRPIWMPAVGGELPQLLDYPVYINNDMPAPAANAKSIAFGNLRSYLIRDVNQFVLFRFDDSAYSLKGQIGFLGMARSGGNLLDLNAVKLYQHSAT